MYVHIFGVYAARLAATKEHAEQVGYTRYRTGRNRDMVRRVGIDVAQARCLASLSSRTGQKQAAGSWGNRWQRVLISRLAFAKDVDPATEGEHAPMSLPSRARVSSNTLERARNGLAECGLMVALFMMYYVTRGVAAGKEAVAFGHAREVMRVEQKMGLFREISLQTFFLTEPTFVRFLNFIYAYTHMAVLIGFAIWVFLFHSRHYPMIRNTFLAVLGTGLTIYILFPLAPPRFFPYTGFVDTLQLYSGVNYDQQGISMLYNPFAAMPSLHVGFALFVGVGLIKVGQRTIHWIMGITYPLLMMTAVVGTANHYILDVVCGLVITIMAYVLVPRVTRMVNDYRNRSRLVPSRPMSF